RLRARPLAEVLPQLGAGRPFDQTPPQLVDQPVRAAQPLRPPVFPEQLIDQLVRDLHLAHHGPPSGPPARIAPTAATPRSSRPRLLHRRRQRLARLPAQRQHPCLRLARPGGAACARSPAAAGRPRASGPTPAPRPPPARSRSGSALPPPPPSSRSAAPAPGNA